MDAMSTDQALSLTHSLSKAKTAQGTNQCLHHMLAIVWQSCGSMQVFEQNKMAEAPLRCLPLQQRLGIFMTVPWDWSDWFTDWFTDWSKMRRSLLRRCLSKVKVDGG